MVFWFKFKDTVLNVRVVYMIVDSVYSLIFDVRANAIHVRYCFKIFCGGF